MRIRKIWIIIAAVLVLIVVVGVVSYQPSSSAPEYAVSTSDPLATEVGMRVLKEGGTAVDAAIAISYTLGVVEPYASGIGGGGSMLIEFPNQKATFIDYREVAPSNKKSEKEGVPGFVAGMDHIHKEYGTMPMNKLIAPAIRYAKEGFTVDQDLHDRLNAYKKSLEVKELRQFFPDKKAVQVGQKVKQEHLAETLERIQEQGKDGFYKGKIAREITDETVISKGDLRSYKVIKRMPLKTTYKNYEVLTAPPPFAGATLVQMLKLVEQEKVWKLYSEHPTLFYHYLGEITRVSYQDRLDKIADPTFIKQAANDWTADQYVKLLANQLDATKAAKVKLSDVEEHESTTHFVVMDAEGTIVSTTNTLSNFFGSGKNVEGFFLNNTLDTFGEGINSIEEGKRPRTFTAPTILRNDDEVIAIGTPGGNRIPQILTQVIGHYVDNKQSVNRAVKDPRVIYDRASFYSEKTLSEEERKKLETYGYEIKKNDNPMFYGGVQVLVKDLKTNEINGGADSRRNSKWQKNIK